MTSCPFGHVTVRDGDQILCTEGCDRIGTAEELFALDVVVPNPGDRISAMKPQRGEVTDGKEQGR